MTGKDGDNGKDNDSKNNGDDGKDNNNDGSNGDSVAAAFLPAVAKVT
jgi:hypothetical protein